MKNLKSLIAQRANVVPVFSMEEFTKSLADKAGTSGEMKAHSKLVQGISNEDFGFRNPEETNAIRDIYEDLSSQLTEMGFGVEAHDPSAITTVDHSDRVNGNRIMAATLAAIGSSDEQRYRKASRAMTTAVVSNEEGVFVVPGNFEGPAGSIPVLAAGKGLENYNEKSQRDFRVVSIGYNLAAARQDAFGETLYPTVVVNPTEGGVTQNLTYPAVMADVFHETTGALFDTKEVNMVEAFRDPSILNDTSTHLYPIVDEQGNNAANFISEDLYTPVELAVRGGTVRTAPLAAGQRIDLIGISNRQQLLAGSLLDITDTIDPALRLKALYLSTANTAAQGDPSNAKLLRFNVERMPTSVFTPALAGDSRQANLNFNTEDLVISKDTKFTDQSTNAALDQIAAEGLVLRLAVSAAGSVSLSKGDCYVHGSAVTVDRAYDSEGQSLQTTSGAIATLINDLGPLTVVGYELDARFTNTNRRERGQLIQTRTVQFRHAIPMHSPITLPMSTMDDVGPGGVIDTLTVATNIRNSANAVTRLLNFAAQLRETVGHAGAALPRFGATDGALSIMMRPTYRHVELDLAEVLDTTNSTDRWSDVCSSILNVIKSVLYPAYRESNIEAVYQTLSGNADERPKFVIAADKEIAHYLMMQGDDRTLGAHLKYDIVSTNNKEFDGKIMVVPTRDKPVENDILNFGQFYYVPTIVADLPIARNGQISREIAAVPFNLHVNNIPFLIEIDVKGLGEVMGTSQFNTRLTP